jgi:two-component system, NarL family, nitrate/nitrite response regulator NarL
VEQISIAIIDDQPLFIEGFKALCERVPHVRLVASAAAVSAASAIIIAHSPKILFIEVASNDVSSGVICSICQLSADVKVVGLTAARSISLAIQTLDAGAYGYVLKQSSSEELILAIQAIGRGEKFITPGFSNKLVAALQDDVARKKAALAIRLSIRESQIARLLLTGKTNKEIALALSISEKTVKHYMTMMMQKLNVRNRLEVAMAAQALAHLDPDSERAH